MDRDLKTLHELVRQVVERMRWTKRRLEEEIGIGHGTLDQLLSGRQDLKARHLLALARLLRVPPHQFLELGCPEVTATAAQDLATWLGRTPEPARAQGPDEERIRAIVRDELEHALRDRTTGS